MRDVPIAISKNHMMRKRKFISAAPTLSWSRWSLILITGCSIGAFPYFLFVAVNGYLKWNVSSTIQSYSVQQANCLRDHFRRITSSDWWHYTSLCTSLSLLEHFLLFTFFFVFSSIFVKNHISYPGNSFSYEAIMQTLRHCISGDITGHFITIWVDLGVQLMLSFWSICFRTFYTRKSSIGLVMVQLLRSDAVLNKLFMLCFIQSLLCCVYCVQ